MIATSIQGKNPSILLSKNEPIVDERKRTEPFHIRVISKHTKIDTLFFIVDHKQISFKKK